MVEAALIVMGVLNLACLVLTGWCIYETTTWLKEAHESALRYARSSSPEEKVRVDHLERTLKMSENSIREPLPDGAPAPAAPSFHDTLLRHGSTKDPEGNVWEIG